MIDRGENPILVCGTGRSGSTWMQWFLSQHPRIHVHGQSPGIPWETFWGWHQVLVGQGKWSEKANREAGYEIAHYAGSDAGRSRAIFRRMLYDYLIGHGPEKPRWGLKWIGLSADPEAVDQFESLWPKTRWVVCLRDPFVTITSVKNTFRPDLDMQEFVHDWVSTCRFIESHPPERVVTIQMDKLAEQTAEERRAAMDRVFACVGEEPSEKTEEFLRGWPFVHKVKPDAQREFALSDDAKQRLLDEVPGLGASMRSLGYWPSRL